MKIYFDFRDWWIGYYRGPNHHYVCPVPTLVIRWPNKVTRLTVPGGIIDIPHEISDDEVNRLKARWNEAHGRGNE